MRKGRKRLSVDLPTEVHEALKSQSEKHNLTITRYLLRIIIGQLKRENDYEYHQRNSS